MSGSSNSGASGLEGRVDVKRLRVGRVGVRGVLGGGWGALCLDGKLWVLAVVEVVEIICEIRNQVRSIC